MVDEEDRWVHGERSGDEFFVNGKWALKHKNAMACCIWILKTVSVGVTSQKKNSNVV